MMPTLTGLFRRWLSQDVARTNAARASVRLQHRRREIEDVDAFLAAQHHVLPKRPGETWSSHAARTGQPRQGPD